MKIFIVISAHNEEKHVEDVIKGLVKTKFPIVVVDDGSTDKTGTKVKSLRVRGLTYLGHRVNLGKGAAMKTGSEYAFGNGADAVIFMDADGQHFAGDLPKFVKALKGGYEVVLGSRNLNFGVPFVRYVGNKAASVLVGFLFGGYISDLICGFRALTRKAYKKIGWESVGYGVETEMSVKTLKLRLKHCEVPVETIYYDSFKGVSVMDAFGILAKVIEWRFFK